MKIIICIMDYYTIWKSNWSKVINEWKNKYSYKFIQNSNIEIQNSMLEFQDYQFNLNNMYDNTIRNLHETFQKSINNLQEQLKQQEIINKTFQENFTNQNEIIKQQEKIIIELNNIIDKSPLVKMKEEIRMLNFDINKFKKNTTENIDKFKNSLPFCIRFYMDFEDLLDKFSNKKRQIHFENNLDVFIDRFTNFVKEYYTLNYNYSSNDMKKLRFFIVCANNEQNNMLFSKIDEIIKNIWGKMK